MIGGYPRSVVDEPFGQPRLGAVEARARACTRCPSLVASRSAVVVGSGPPRAPVVLVTGAPGAHQDALGAALVGRAARLVDRALADAGLARAAVYVTPLVKCLPPGNRTPTPAEVAHCSGHLVAQVEAVEPIVVIALGAFVAKTLCGDLLPIRERRGREEPCVLGALPVWLLPVFDPAAALYDPALAAALRADLGRVPELLARGRPELGTPPVEAPGTPSGDAEEPAAVAGPDQLDLF